MIMGISLFDEVSIGFNLLKYVNRIHKMQVAMAADPDIQDGMKAVQEAFAEYRAMTGGKQDVKPLADVLAQRGIHPQTVIDVLQKQIDVSAGPGPGANV